MDPVLNRLRLLGTPVALALLLALGCAPESAPSREEKQEVIVIPHATQHQSQQHNQFEQPSVQPLAPGNIDDAKLVLQSCGAPQTDTVVALHTKLNDGPVRRLVYRGRQLVTLDFIPSLPTQANQTGLPSGAVWRFSEGHMENQELLTARRLTPFLPCAAQALASEY